MWRYQALLNQNIQIILEIATGALAVLVGPISYKVDFNPINRLLFYVLFPAAIISALGIRTDLRAGSTWRFVAAWIMFRSITLVAVVLVVGVGMRRGLGDITVNWLCTTWVSAVVLGIPVVKAALGDQYAALGAVAAISSYIFQLPLSLLMLEMNGGRTDIKSLDKTKEEETLAAGNTTLSVLAAPQPVPKLSPVPQKSPVLPTTVSNDDNNKTKGAVGGDTSENGAVNPTTTDPENAAATTTQQMQSSLSRRLSSRPSMKDLMKGEFYTVDWKALWRRVSRNIIIWSILIAIIVSVTTLGPKYLNPGDPPLKPNPSYVPGVGWIFMYLTQLALCVEPIALFVTGVFIWVHRPSLKLIWRAALYMIIKLILIPMLMVGCCFAVGLEGGNARASVLIAALPIAPASITVATVYNRGREEMIENIFFGNLLILPTTLGWMAVMDSINLFPLPQVPVAVPPPVPPPCPAIAPAPAPEAAFSLIPAFPPLAG